MHLKIISYLANPALVKVAAPSGKIKVGKKARAGSADDGRKGSVDDGRKGVEGEEEVVPDEDEFAKRIQEVRQRPRQPYPTQ